MFRPKTTPLMIKQHSFHRVTVSFKSNNFDRKSGSLREWASYFKENAFTTCTVPTTVPGKGILFWELIKNTEIIILVTHVMLYSSEKFNSNDTNSTIFGLQYFQRLKKKKNSAK